ncbi:MAG: DUF99 family protein [Candidatus Aenigmatarchaeota archaeon]
MSITEVKDEVRILGWDDSPFDSDDNKIPLVGSVLRGGKPYLDGILVEEITVDGFDVTEKIIEATSKTKHRDQLRILMLDGITFAGFNTADIEKIYEDTELPVIVVTRKNTDFKSFRKAMKELPKFEKRWDCVRRAGELKEHSFSKGNLYFQHKGISEEKTREVIEMTASKSLTPEPIRISHLIASGVKEGESIGGA